MTARRRLKLKVGGRYRLRNGASVLITSTYPISFKEGRTGKAMQLRMFLGLILGTTGEKLSFHQDGSYSPVAEHYLDCVSRETT